jgi:Leucine-rich repeat (LRR) protein
LDIENNFLNWIPDGISALKKLKYLNLKRNEIIKIPSFNRMPNLKFLDISENPELRNKPDLRKSVVIIP